MGSRCAWRDDKTVKLACLIDLSGPGKYGGPPIVDAFKDYVAWVNDTGGIHGRKIDMIYEDNGILPTPTMAAARKVILKDEVLALPLILECRHQCHPALM